MMLIFVFVRVDTRNAQSQCERNTEMSISCYLFVSASINFFFCSNIAYSKGTIDHLPKRWMTIFQNLILNETIAKMYILIIESMKN